MSITRRYLPALLLGLGILTMSGPWGASRVTGTVVEPFFERFGFSRDVAEVLHAALRKCGHLAAYALFAMLALRSVRGIRPTTWRAAGIAFAITVGLSCLDETLQSLSSGRGGKATDIAVDALGALIGLAVAVPFARKREAAATVTSSRVSPAPRVPVTAGASRE